MTEQELLLLAIQYAQKYPKIALALTAVGALRVVMKPAISFITWWIAQTPSKRDDKKLKKILANRYVKAFLYVVDWLGSVKLKVESKPEGGADAVSKE